MKTFSQHENVDFLLYFTGYLSIWGVQKSIKIASQKIKNHEKSSTLKTEKKHENVGFWCSEGTPGDLGLHESGMNLDGSGSNLDESELAGAGPHNT